MSETFTGSEMEQCCFWCHLATHLRKGPALTLQAALGREGHAGPGGGAVEHDPAVGFTNSTTGERGQGVKSEKACANIYCGTRTERRAHLLHRLHEDIHKKEGVKRDNKNVGKYLEAVGILATRRAAAPGRRSDLKVRRCGFHFCHLQDKEETKASRQVTMMYISPCWLFLERSNIFSNKFHLEINLKCFFFHRTNFFYYISKVSYWCCHLRKHDAIIAHTAVSRDIQPSLKVQF